MTCKEVSTLMAQNGLASASLGRRLTVRLHLAMCRQCRAFRRQLEAISQAARSRAERQEPGPEFEARLIQRLRDGGPPRT